MAIIGYKAAFAYNKRVVVTLEIPDDALTNLLRENAVVKEYAKYRCNKAKVVKIEDIDGKEYEEAITVHYDKNSLTYKLNETVSVHRFDTKLEEVCSTGIHFFLTKRVAELYNLKSIINMFYESWHDNGIKKFECNFVDRTKDGVGTQWYENGKLNCEYNYLQGNKNGLCTDYYENGSKKCEATYKDDKLDGLKTEWYVNGTKKSEATYKDEKLDGLKTEWYENGTKRFEATYKDNILDGLKTEWYENGLKSYECMCENGIKKGFEKKWAKDGRLMSEINNMVLSNQHQECCTIC